MTKYQVVGSGGPEPVVPLPGANASAFNTRNARGNLMPPFADSRAERDSIRVFSPGKVDRGSNRLRVLGIDAVANAAQVVEHEPVRDRTNQRHIHISVCQPLLITGLPVSAAIGGSLPNPARRRVTAIFNNVVHWGCALVVVHEEHADSRNRRSASAHAQSARALRWLHRTTVPGHESNVLAFHPSRKIAVPVRDRRDLPASAHTETGWIHRRSRIVGLRHLSASLQALRGVAARGVSSTAGLLHSRIIPNERIALCPN